MMLATSWDVIRFNQRERVCEGERDMRPAFMNVPSSHLPWSLMTLKPMARGLHSSTFRLNVSAFCGIGCARKGCLWGVMGYYGVFRVYFSHKRLRLS
jgi:hypothetical protein